MMFVLIMIGCVWSLSLLCTRAEFYDEKVWILGVSVLLHCNNSAQYLSAHDDSVPVSWMLPDRSVLTGDYGRFQLLNGNWTLKVTNVTSDDVGVYYCLLRQLVADEVKWLVLRIGLNAAGPYFNDLWADKYWFHTVFSLSAACGFLLITAIIYAIYHFRYQPEHDQHRRVTVVGVARRRSGLCTSTSGGERSECNDEESSPVSVNQQDITSHCTTKL